MIQMHVAGDTNWKVPQSTSTIEVVTVTSGYPSFSGGGGQPCIAHIYLSHYQRLQTVAVAARSGNTQLIQLALAELDKWGSRDEKPA